MYLIQGCAGCSIPHSAGEISEEDSWGQEVEGQDITMGTEIQMDGRDTVGVGQFLDCGGI